jgi:hypothetical protein
MTQCQPFDFYQPTDYSGYTDDRLTERRTLGFGGAVVAISGRARGTGVSPS